MGRLAGAAGIGYVHVQWILTIAWNGLDACWLDTVCPAMIAAPIDEFV
jgi:hypothetical protein